MTTLSKEAKRFAVKRFEDSLDTLGERERAAALRVCEAISDMLRAKAILTLATAALMTMPEDRAVAWAMAILNEAATGRARQDTDNG